MKELIVKLKSIKITFKQPEATPETQAKLLINGIMVMETLEQKIKTFEILESIFENELKKHQEIIYKEKEATENYFAKKIKVIDPIFLQPIKK